LEGNCDTLTPINEGLSCNDGDVCLIGETCQSGVCTGGAAPDCSGAGDQCNSASCDPAGSEGNCDTLTPINEGLACNDGDVCLIGETCQSGVCTGGGAPDCSSAGDQCNAASCDASGAEGNCDTLTPINEGLSCDDGDVCLIGETCQSGVCTGSAAPDCSGAGDQCDDASCDPAGLEGNCDVWTPVTDGTSCDDGDVCNVGETCQSGVCSGGTAPDCSGAGDQCNTASCDAGGLEGNCDTLTPINEGLPCDDSDVCLIGETCQSGVCAGGAAPDCSGASDQCNAASCDPAGAEGNCDTWTPVSNGTSCDDGDVCNVGETCQAGVCVGGAAPNCSGAGDQCNTASCDPVGAEGNCDTWTPVTDGTACDDGAACNVGETCQSGVCAGGSPQDCSGAGDQCNNAACDPAGAEGNCDTLTPINEGLSCDDSDVCLIGETCQLGVCTGGAAPDCSGAGDQCNDASCDPAGLEGNCDTLTPAYEGLACDDGDACLVGETCQSGVCTGGAAPDCSGAGDQCNDASCDPAGFEGNCDTWTPVADGTSCDDGDVCNVGETCQSGVCTGGADPDCSGAGDQCNDASCDVAGTEGNCDIWIPVLDGTGCDDGLFCTATDTCQSGICTGTGDPCAVDEFCNELTDACDSCQDNLDCDDGSICTIDVCNAGACEYTATNEGMACNDGDACLLGETCQAGVCTGGTAPDCSASGDQCNTASCDPVGLEGNCDTITPVTDGTSCDDGDVCIVGETCQSGVCTGGVVPDCSGAGDQCNSASCDAAGAEGNCDTLTPINEGLACDDGDACLFGETCQSGVCTGGAAPDCSAAGDQCNGASCDPAGLEGNCDTWTPVLDGTSCDDGDVCLVGETCQSGVCTGGAAPDCSGAGDQCNDASCDPAGAEGNCDVITQVTDGTSCDDGDACLIGETCQSGVCTGGAAPNCGGAGDQCNTASCDPLGLEGNCDIITPVSNGTDCDDGDACLIGETCQSGACTGGTVPDCSGAGDQCNAASCDPAGVEGNCDIITPVTDGTSCNDGDVCNVDETCQSGVCTGGAAPDCSGAGDQCNFASCDLAGAEGNCDTLTPINEGLPCDDGDACLIGETCQTGVCTGGAAPDCSGAGDQCNSASCDPAGLEGNCDTLTPSNEGLSCDDGDVCLIGETCQTGE
jgi:hypothetical protein